MALAFWHHPASAPVDELRINFNAANFQTVIDNENSPNIWVDADTTDGQANNVECVNTTTLGLTVVSGQIVGLWDDFKVPVDVPIANNFVDLTPVGVREFHVESDVEFGGAGAGGEKIYIFFLNIDTLTNCHAYIRWMTGPNRFELVSVFSDATDDVQELTADTPYSLEFDVYDDGGVASMDIIIDGVTVSTMTGSQALGEILQIPFGPAAIEYAGSAGTLSFKTSGYILYTTT